MARAGWRDVTVGILYNVHLHLARGLARDALSEADTLNTVRAARTVVRGAGARVLELGLGPDPRPVLERLLRRPPDVVLNLCDAPLGDSSLEPTLPAFLKLAWLRGMMLWLRIHYVDKACPNAASWIRAYWGYSGWLDGNAGELTAACGP